MSLITIDGLNYNIGETSCTRNADVITDQLTAGTLLDLTEVNDVIGVKYSYSFTIEPRNMAQDEYDRFFYAVTAPKNHVVTIPYNQELLTFECKIESAGDMLKRAFKANKWGGMSVTFVPLKPQRVNLL